ncbi:MAG: hypothetical protein HYV97_11840 [Bdellovibrio sp.]|nr:hypothetical protein [Bdellovibrio sp.]
MEKEKVHEILKNVFRQITPEINFDNLDKNLPLRDQVDIDSFDFYNIIVLLQKNINIVIPDSTLAELKNLKQLIDFIMAKGKET